VGVRLAKFVGGELGGFQARSVIGGQRHCFHLASPLGGHLRFEISQRVCETALAQGTGEAFFHRANQPGRAIGDDEHGVREGV
jgi:hypothetical protein